VPEKLPDFTTVLKALRESGAQVVLIGGVAMNAHGTDTATFDIDFAFARTRQTERAIAQALGRFHPRPKGFPEGLPFVWDETTVHNMTTLTLATAEGDVDFLAEPDGAPPFTELAARALEVEVFGERVLVASIDDLIAMKRAAGRPKDLLHIMHLEAAKKRSDT